MNRRFHSWSRDAEANDMIHMGSDQKECHGETCDPRKNSERGKAKKREFNER